MSECCVQTGPDVIFHTDMEWLPAHERGRTCCFHHTKLLLLVPGRQWPEENNLMTQEYAGMSTGRGRTGKCRYSTGAKIFLLLLAVSTVAALSGLYQVLTY
ncbi:membrane protein [Salmonella enterica]|nr:membrane protein [Salmonella enterica]